MVNNDNRTVNEMLAEFNGVNEASQDEIDRAAEEFLAYAQKRLKEYAADSGFTKFPENFVLKTTLGKKYIKIIQRDSVYGFINRENGDILFAAGFNTPAKHARGNVLDKASWVKAISKSGQGIASLKAGYGTNY
jgi:hypothetical protein